MHKYAYKIILYIVRLYVGQKMDEREHGRLRGVVAYGEKEKGLELGLGVKKDFDFNHKIKGFESKE